MATDFPSKISATLLGVDETGTLVPFPILRDQKYTFADKIAAIETDLAAINTVLGTINTSVAAIKVDLDKFTFDSSNRLKTGDAFYQTPQTGVLLAATDTLIYTAAANQVLTVVVCNVSAAARTFQLSHGTLTDTNSLYKNFPLQLGSNTSFSMSIASGDVLRGLCDSANGVTVRVYAGAA